MLLVGLAWVLLERAGSGAFAWFLAVAALPHLLLAACAGRWVSALGVLRAAVAADAARGALFVALAAAWPALPASRQVAALFAAGFFSNAAGALFNPALMSLPAAIAGPEAVQGVTALLDASLSSANVVGPACAAALYPRLGLRGLLLLNGLSYAAAALTESRVRERSSRAGADDGPARAWPEVLRGDRLTRFLLGNFLAMNLLLAPLFVFLPLFARQAYGGTIATLAWLESALALGNLAASAALSLRASAGGAGASLAAGMSAAAASYLLFALTRAPWQGCLCLGLLGFFQAAANVFALTLFQTRPRPSDVPVVMSLVNAISTASLPLSMGALALIVARVDARALALGCSACLALLVARMAADAELRAA